MNRAKLIKIATIVGCCALALILVLAIVYVNVIYKEVAVEGYEIGEKCPDFELSAYKTAGNPNGETFSSADAKGKVLVINFWYINCGGCVAELPHFNEVQQEYNEDVEIIVVHAHNIDTRLDKQENIDRLGFGDYMLNFVQDTEELNLYKKLGGDGNFPITIVLDKEGIIQSVNIGSMTKEKLVEEVEKYL